MDVGCGIGGTWLGSMGPVVWGLLSVPSKFRGLKLLLPPKVWMTSVEAGDNAAAAPQDTSAASPSDCTSSSRLSCSSRLSQVTQCMPTSSHALHTSCQSNSSYGAPQSIVL